MAATAVGARVVAVMVVAGTGAVATVVEGTERGVRVVEAKVLAAMAAAAVMEGHRRVRAVRAVRLHVQRCNAGCS